MSEDIPSAPDDAEVVPLPTRTPADAADVFFQVRQVDGPSGVPTGVDEPGGVKETSGAGEPGGVAETSGVEEASGADEPGAPPETVAESSPPVVVPVGEDLTQRPGLVDEPTVDRFGEDWPVAFAFNHHQVAGSGEDSEPILRTGRDVGLLAVFDGMGGAGGTMYETPDGPRSGAYLSSRVARDVAEVAMVDWLNSSAGAADSGIDDDGGQAAQLLQQSVQQALQARLTELHAPTSRLRSKLLRALPTTMALVAAHRADAGQGWWCDVLWAGDSRVYALDAAGLHQLTVDDIRDHGDAMANLREDSVVSNAMSADTAFVVNHRLLQLDEPFLLVAATDGCFGYLPSPMHFEHLLLSGLHGAQNATQWSDAVRTAITAVAGDDASMVIAGVGADLAGLQALTADRLQALRERSIGPLDASAAEVDRLVADLERARQRQAELSAELWTTYRPDYSRYLPESKDGMP